MTQAQVIFSAGASREFSAASAESADDKGVARQSFRKDMIAVGNYRHPTKGWELAVDAARMDRWVNNFHAMRKNGVDVEVVVDHSHKAEAVRGYLLDLYREGDRLYGVHEMRGANGISLAKTVKNVSVWIEPNFKDGKGNEYGEAITHSAIVQKPVVPGQLDFLPIAASSVDVLTDLQTGNKDMDLSALKPFLGDDLTDANLISKITALKTKAEALPAKPDASAMSQLAEAAYSQLDGMAMSGIITPAEAKDLGTILVGARDDNGVVAQPIAMSLSATLAGTPKALAFSVIESIKANRKPAQRGGTAKTGSQQGGGKGLSAADGGADEKSMKPDSWVEDEIKRSNAAHATK